MYDLSFNIKGKDELDSVVYVWEPKDPKGVLQIVHGSVEHMLRYEHFASFLKEAGYIVYGHDIRGHGKSVKCKDELSYFSDWDKGFDLAIDDVKTIGQIISEKHPTLKHFVLAHSMGTIIVRKLITESNDYCDGVVLSGTGGGKPLLLNAGIYLSKRSMRKNGRKYQDQKLHNLLYGTLNNGVKHPKTDLDFLSRDEVNVKNYIADELCGVTVTAEYIFEMLKAIKFVNSKKAYHQTDKNIPLYLFSGENDPVGGKKGKEVIQIYNKFKSFGVKDVKMKLYPEARHEILNETNKQEVYQDIIEWMMLR